MKNLNKRKNSHVKEMVFSGQGLESGREKEIIFNNISYNYKIIRTDNMCTCKCGVVATYKYTYYY